MTNTEEMESSSSSSGVASEFAVTKDEVDSLVAELCAATDSSDVKECIRSYKYGRNFNQLKRDFNRFNKPVLLSTMEHLNVPVVSNTTKPDLVQKVILRFQNLLPDICNECDQRYQVKKDDDPLLCCKICGQEVHRECFINKYVREDLQEDLTAEKVQEIINPLGISGMYYVCKPCAKSADIDVKSDVASDNAEVSSTSNDSQIIDHSKSPPTDKEVLNRKTQGNAESNVKKRTCYFFLRNKCKHGRSGKSCKFAHPNLCNRYLNFGTTEKGCRLGRKCKYTHPKMCYSSLETGQCLKTNCTYYHTKNTSFVPFDNSYHPSQLPRDHSVSNNNHRQSDVSLNDQNYDDAVRRGPDFLSQTVEKMRADLMEAIDLRLSKVVSTFQPQPTGWPPNRPQRETGFLGPQFSSDQGQFPPLHHQEPQHHPSMGLGQVPQNQNVMQQQQNMLPLQAHVGV